jgi:hypothetical protein
VTIAGGLTVETECPPELQEERHTAKISAPAGHTIPARRRPDITVETTLPTIPRQAIVIAHGADNQIFAWLEIGLRPRPSMQSHLLGPPIQCPPNRVPKRVPNSAILSASQDTSDDLKPLNHTQLQVFGVLAMQKVEGSSPFIRSQKPTET